MKTSLMIVAALALVAVGLNHAGVLPQSAEAAAKYQANLTWDGGATGVSQVALVGANQTIRFDPVISAALPNGSQFCYKTCPTSTCVPDCTKDFVLNQPSTTYQTADAGPGYTLTNAPPPILDPIQMGTKDNYVVVSSLDAGNPNVNLYLETSNLKQ